MTMAYPAEIPMHVNPVDDWITAEYEGSDWLRFADPFSEGATPNIMRQAFSNHELSILDPNTPPDTFLANPDLQRGYRFLKAVGKNHPKLKFAIYLNASETEADINEPDLVGDLMYASDLAVLGYRRGVAHEHWGRQRLGELYQREFTDYMYDQARNTYHKDLISLEPEYDRGGVALTQPDRLIEDMRTSVTAIGQVHGLESSPYIMGDLAERNISQWRTAGKIGQVLAAAHKQGKLLNGVFGIFLDVDQADVDRRLYELGVPGENIWPIQMSTHQQTEEFAYDRNAFEQGGIRLPDED